ncbi:unnamed protein product, partial [Closterium sp. NIES-54]
MFDSRDALSPSTRAHEPVPTKGPTKGHHATMPRTTSGGKSSPAAWEAALSSWPSPIPAGSHRLVVLMLLAAVAALFLAEFVTSPAQINSPARLGDGAWWAAASAERGWRKAGPDAGDARTAGMEGGGEEGVGKAQGNEGQWEQEQQQEHQGEWPQQTDQQQVAWSAVDEAKARENKERGEEGAAVSEGSSDGSSSAAERVGAALPQTSQAPQLSPQQQQAYRGEMKRAAAQGERYYLVWSPTWDRCVGQSHWSWTLKCVAAEAKALQRTLVLVTDRCLSQTHSKSGLMEHKHVGL